MDSLLGEHRFDNWAENAVFQFHPVVSTTTPVLSEYPRLEVSIADLFHLQPIGSSQLVNAFTEHQLLVTNALLRIVHGGWEVGSGTSHEFFDIPNA